MIITALMDLSKLPNQSQDQATFDANMAYLVDNLPERGRQENELAANLNAVAAGGAYAIPYVFDTATTDADPGPGKLRLSSAVQNAATAMRLDLIAGGQDFTSVLDTFDASTSAVKGSIRLIKFGDLTKWMTFDVIARTAPAGYRNFAVVCTGSSSASPFMNGDGVMLFFQRTGDKGDTGAAAINPAAKFSDRKPVGTSGGTNAVGEQVRTLNTTDYNSIGATLSGNQVTLPAGTYDIQGRAPAHNVGYHRATLYNVSDSAVALIGSSEYSAPTASVQTSSEFSGRLVLASAKTFSVRHYTSQVTNTTGLGNAVSGSGLNETYTELNITKVA